MYIILNWWCDETLARANIVIDESGKNLVFDTEKDAEEYAKKELNGYWLVVGEEYAVAPDLLEACKTLYSYTADFLYRMDDQICLADVEELEQAKEAIARVEKGDK